MNSSQPLMVCVSYFVSSALSGISDSWIWDRSWALQLLNYWPFHNMLSESDIQRAGRMMKPGAAESGQVQLAAVCSARTHTSTRVYLWFLCCNHLCPQLLYLLQRLFLIRMTRANGCYRALKLNVTVTLLGDDQCIFLIVFYHISL